jgi:CBS domain-containing protein
MITVKNLLEVKGDAVYATTPQATVLDALRVMAEKNVGALVVLDGERLVGVISERDFVQEIAKTGVCIIDELVEGHMTKSVITVRPEDTLDECMGLMTVKRIRHLPVVEKEKLVGLVSIGDVVKGVISTREMTIEQLENYIEGRGYGR